MLEAGDVAGLTAHWAQAMPHLPQPSREQAEIVMHMTRTATESLSLAARAYSHAWLTERLIPSQLPDHLKPAAEQLHPKVVGAVGIAVQAGTGMHISQSERAPALLEVRGAMETAVLETYADGHEHQPEVVKSRMMEARSRTLKQLFGRR